MGTARATEAGRAAPGPRGRGGFSLVELVIAISITSVLALAAARFVASPVAGYVDATRRARLVDRAETALQRMGREIRLALPNSVRVSADARALELLRVRTAGRYRQEPPGDPLDATATADTFDVVGTLDGAGGIVADPAATPADCPAGNVDCLVIYNTGQPGADAYAGDNVAAVVAASPSAVGFTAAAPFPFASPGRRFYVVDTPVTYLCEPAAGRITRHSGYGLWPDQASVDTAAELAAAGSAGRLLTEGVTGCSFRYDPGTATRSAVVTLEISLAEGGETVTLLQQAHVANVP